LAVVSVSYPEALTTAEPVGAFITNFWGNNVHAFCDDDDQYAKDLAAQSMKTFFGPDKPGLGHITVDTCGNLQFHIFLLA